MNVLKLMKIINTKLPPYIWAWIAKYKNYEEQSGSGTLVFENTYGQKFSKFDVEGQTSQESTDGRQLFDINGNVNQIYNGSTSGNLNVVNGNDLTSSYNTGMTYARGQRIYIGTGNTVKFKFKFKSINGRIEGADPLVGVANIYEDNNSTPINTIYLKTDNVGTELSKTITATTDYLIFAFSGWTSRAESITVTDIVVTVSNDTSWEPYSGGIPRTKSILSISY